MRRAFVLASALLALPVLAGGAAGGSYAPPPGDAYPVWSPDGRALAYLTGRGVPALVVVAPDGSGETRLLEPVPSTGAYVSPSGVALSPDWRSAAVVRFTSSAYVLTVVRLDGGEERRLAPASFGTRPSWSPDSRRVAFRMEDGKLAAITFDGGELVVLAPGGAALAWSPDGTRIAYMGGDPQDPGIYVVGADGRGAIEVGGGSGVQLEPKWSPAGDRIAFLTQRARGEQFSYAVVRPDGSGLRVYDSGPGVSNQDSYTWTSDGRALVYAHHASQGLFRLDLDTGTATRLTRFGGMPAVSPDGSRIAFVGGGECRDRSGVYVAQADGRGVRRLSNDCRILGSAGADVINGTRLADVLVGLGGNDRLIARAPGYVGDTLLGGDGDDILLGAVMGDLLRGGRGDDRLRGGNSQDVLYGGPGRDFIDGQRGLDQLYARDGRRDVVVCGTNVRRSSIERDEAWVDRDDRVAPDCEVVHRG